MVESFTSFQRTMWRRLSNIGICRYYIDVTDKGRYKIKFRSIGAILFCCFWTSNLSKFIYHFLTFKGLLGVKVGCGMSMWDWFSMYAHVFMECMVWFFKYPMWENLYRQWEVQEDVYRKLGRPLNAAKKITRTDRINIFVYGGVVSVGTLAFIIQFFWTPKYALNTYAIVPWDTPFLRIIFCIHESAFIGHGYIYQASTMVLGMSYAVSFQHLLEEMNKTLGSLIIASRSTFAQRRMQSAMSTASAIFSDGGGDEGDPDYFDLRQPVFKMDTSKLISGDEKANPKAIAPGTEYDIRSLLNDYRKIMISAQFHNQWIGKVMGIPEGINYIQFVMDVFMIIQLLQDPELDYFGVAFYIMDAIFGMIMIFRMFILLSRLYPQSEEFIHGLKLYAGLNTPMRKELMKTIPSLRLVAAKLTGYSVRPGSVPTGVNILINWYIAAAMWKRPDDPTRRT